MVLKSWSGAYGDIGKAVRYIFKNREPESASFGALRHALINSQVDFTYQDIRFLLSEVDDVELLQTFKDCGYDIHAFLEEINTGVLLSKVNMRGANSLDKYTQILKQSYDSRLYKGSNAIGYLHMMISYSPKDKEHISLVMLKDISNKYCELHGSKNIYISAAHVEKQHSHIHVLVGAADLYGKSSSIRQHRFAEIKLELDKYTREKYPEIIHSSPVHAKALSIKNHRTPTTEKMQTQRRNEVAKADKVVETIYSTVQSSTELFSKIKEHGYEVYYRSGQPQGLLHSETGMKMRWKNFSVDIKEMLANEAEAEKTMKNLRKATKPERQVKDTPRDEPFKSEEERLMAELSAMRGSTDRYIEYVHDDYESIQPNSDNSLEANEIDDVKELQEGHIEEEIEVDDNVESMNDNEL